MRRLGATVLLVISAACGVPGVDSGPVLTANEGIDAGKAGKVSAEIRMGGGELRLDGGAARLMEGSFKFSDRPGRPMVRYTEAGGHGRLTLESPKTDGTFSKTVNEWTVKLGSSLPLELNITLGGGKADLDVSRLSLESMQVNMGAGELQLNLAGHYKKDVSVQVKGGAGEMRIRLPGDMGAVVDAQVGIGGLNAHGLQQRDGKYYNAAYAEGKPAIHLEVQGAVGDITLSVE